MRWWGWGDPAHAPLLTPSALSFLADTVGVAARPRPPVALGEVRLPRSTLSEQSLVAMRAMVGAYNVRDDHFERVIHAAGKGYPDRCACARATHRALPTRSSCRAATRS